MIKVDWWVKATFSFFLVEQGWILLTKLRKLWLNPGRDTVWVEEESGSVWKWDSRQISSSWDDFRLNSLKRIRLLRKSDFQSWTGLSSWLNLFISCVPNHTKSSFYSTATDNWIKNLAAWVIKKSAIIWVRQNVLRRKTGISLCYSFIYKCHIFKPNSLLIFS